MIDPWDRFLHPEAAMRHGAHRAPPTRTTRTIKTISWIATAAAAAWLIILGVILLAPALWPITP